MFLRFCTSSEQGLRGVDQYHPALDSPYCDEASALCSHEDLLLDQKLLSETPSQCKMVEILVGGNACGTNTACILLTPPRDAATRLVTPHKQVWNVLNTLSRGHFYLPSEVSCLFPTQPSEGATLKQYSFLLNWHMAGHLLACTHSWAWLWGDSLGSLRLDFTLLDPKKPCLKAFFYVPSNHIPAVSFFVCAPFLLSNSFLPVFRKACLGPKAYVK